jgi:iron complex outermembrane recepter protein
MNKEFSIQPALYMCAAMGFAMAAPAFSQSASTAASADNFALEEIVVTARRKDESLQDVPTTINAVTGDEIQKLNITNFRDIASVVPGLSMSSNANGVGASASVRGVNYDVNASGNNGTVEFYQNDAPISAGNLFQVVYDIQQVELLRGPQGTLRGRASPSGSMTVTTRRPNLSEMGGSAAASANNIGGYNVQGAFGMPIVSDVLAIRLAGAYDKNEANRVVSINNPQDPSVKTKSGRATIRFEPTDSLSFNLTAQKTRQDMVTFDQVESQQAVDVTKNVVYVPPTGGTAPVFITAGQRLSVEDVPRVGYQDYNNYNFQAQWAFLGQKLNYVGARNEQHFVSFESNDVGDRFPTNYPAFTKDGFGQDTDSHSWSTAHELRLSSEERVAGIFDYIVGAFYQMANNPTDLLRPVAVNFAAGSPPAGGVLTKFVVQRRGGSTEKSVFANLTAQVTDALEVSGGARYIEYNARGSLYQGATAATLTRSVSADQDQNSYASIYTGTVKYKFTEDMMAYATVGTSWRPGISVIGSRNVVKTPEEIQFSVLQPEKSTSYEVGFKASALDRRLRTAVSGYYQDFKNYPYRSPGGVAYLVTSTATPSVQPFNFVAAVPVKVFGVEAEVNYAPISQWDIGVNASVAKGEIKDGTIPCNDYAPADGIPDTANTLPSAATIQASGKSIAGCVVNQRSSIAPQWSGAVQSEYRLPVTDTLSSFARAQMSVFGNSKNDPTNNHDDYDSYELLNLYLGIRNHDSTWEVALYGKNVTNTERVLARSLTTMTAVTANNVSNYFGGNATEGERMTPPREFGLSVRYAFGSK